LEKGDEEEWRKNFLLSVYWNGKTAEVEEKDLEGCRALAEIAVHLDVAMGLCWHPRINGYNDPLPLSHSILHLGTNQRLVAYA
jgi:hypothetical protein